MHPARGLASGWAAVQTALVPRAQAHPQCGARLRLEDCCARLSPRTRSPWGLEVLHSRGPGRVLAAPGVDARLWPDVKTWGFI